MLKPLRISKQDGKIVIHDYPNAICLKRIDTQKSRQLKALMLHLNDLQFCKDALNQIERIGLGGDQTLIDSLWISSLAKYFKCFGNSKSRIKLSPKKVLKGYAGAESVFKYFKHLRDKHVIHDENPYSQAFTAAVVNSTDTPQKIADIVALGINANTCNDCHYKQLWQLISITFDWVMAKQASLHNSLANEYEQLSYDELLALPDVQYTAPLSNSIDKNR